VLFADFGSGGFDASCASAALYRAAASGARSCPRYDGAERRSMSERRLAAILCADVVGYSRLMGADEEGTLARLKAVRREVVDPSVKGHGGRIVKTTGDGLLIEFASAIAAVRCAVEVQAAMAMRGGPIAFRVGVNLGDVIHEKGDVFGDGVNVASRLEELCPPGEVCVAGSVFDQVRDKLALDCEDLGEQQVKNIARPLRAWRVRAAANYAAASERPRRRMRAPLLAGAAAALLGLGALFVGQAPPEPPTAIAPSPAAHSLSVAVLPFANLSGERQDDALVDGISEDLITDLSRISGAFVIARNTSFTYKGKAIDARQAARELGVRHILEGSVRRVGESLRINAQLIDAETGAQAWADRFDVPRADVYRAQDEVVGRIARALNMELKEAVSRRAARGRPEDLEAADLATHAWAILFNKPQTPETNEEARPVLEQVVALDPRNAEAWTGLSYVHVRAALYGWSPSRDVSLKLALEAGERAVALDPRSADAYYVLGFSAHVDNQTERAAALFQRCVELNPNYAPAYFWLGWIEIFEGRPQNAPALVQKAFRLSPLDGLSAVWRSALATAYVLVGDDEAAVQEARRGIAENPRHPPNHALLASALALRGELDQARAALGRSIELRPQHDTIAGVLRHARPSPELYAQRFARYLEGLRKAGLPES